MRIDQQLGLEAVPFCPNWERGPRCAECYICTMVEVFDSVKRVLRHDGTLWLNVGTSYKAKQDLGIPWRLALALQAAGWILRSEIIWHKICGMPESVTDRPTRAHEQVFLLTKSPQYFYDALAIQEPAQDWGTRDRSTAKHNTEGFRVAGQPPHTGLTNGNAAATGRNCRTVWPLASEPSPPGSTHFAAMPSALVERCLRAGTSLAGCCSRCQAPYVRAVERERVKSAAPSGNREIRRWDPAPEGQLGWRCLTHTTGWRPSCTCQAPTQPCTVLDPFAGSGTCGVVALRLNLHAILIDLSADYITLARERCAAEQPLFAQEVPYG